VYRKGVRGGLIGDATIMPGDIVHCDTGFSYLGLCTDTQRNCYVLNWDEEKVPENIEALAKLANRVEDIFASNFIEGRTGNEILKASLDQCKAEGIKCRIFTHPIGNHGHAAGPTIGLSDQQNGVPGNGDLKLYNNTCYSFELSVTAPLPEWGEEEFQIGFETNVAFYKDQIYYLGGRQTKFFTAK